jgi:hypothetical protein
MMNGRAGSRGRGVLRKDGELNDVLVGHRDPPNPAIDSERPS